MAGAPAISEEDLAELLRLTRASDSVELKLTVPESDQRAAVAALGMDPLRAQIRQVYFFDTPDLALNRVGLVVRARRVQGKGDDSVVKLRPVVPDELPGKLRKTPGFFVEVDALPGGFVCSASLKSPVQGGGVRNAVLGGGRLGGLFSKRQRAYFAAHAPRTCRSEGWTSPASSRRRPARRSSFSRSACALSPEWSAELARARAAFA